MKSLEPGEMYSIARWTHDYTVAVNTYLELKDRPELQITDDLGEKHLLLWRTKEEAADAIILAHDDPTARIIIIEKYDDNVEKNKKKKR